VSASGPIRGLRGRLLAAVLAAVVVGVVLLTAAFNIVLRSQLDSDADQLLRARAAAQIATLSTSGGRLAVGEAPDDAAADAPVWIFAAGRALERPQRPAPAVDRAAVALAGGGRRSTEVASPQTRLLAVPVRRGGRTLGTVVVAASLAPYERTESVALVVSLVVAGISIVAALLVARWLLSAALRPVGRMTAEAAAWSEHDLDRRFGLGPPTDELTRLAATLDGLLDRLAASLRREQRLSAELSHELRTPLARISTQAQLLSGPEAGAIERAAAEMREVIDVLMAAARAEADGDHGNADVSEAAEAGIGAAGPAAGDRGIKLELRASGGVRAAAEPELVERMLAPLLDNALRHADTRASVTVARSGAWVELVVADDGPGVPPGEELDIFEPGRRGSGSDGAGLGLALARRLARSTGGDLVADPAARGGRFVVRLPPASG
jgi:signal transduction histidine kinase